MAPTTPDRRKEVLDLLEAFYKEYMQGRLKTHTEHLSEDVVLLGPGEPKVLLGKQSYLAYLKKLSQKSWLRRVKTQVEDVKFLGDTAIVCETYTSELHIRGKDYQEVGRTTAVVVCREGRWYVTHMHMEPLVRNRIVVGK